MNRRVVIKILGLILMLEAAFMILPALVAVIYRERDWVYFLPVIALCIVVGAAMFRIRLKSRHMYAREGLVVVGLAWVIMSLVGAVPFFVSGFIPDFINAVFESVSGFTTSGISVAPDVETASHAMLFWRSLTHWIGGMGVLVFMLAITPVVGGSSMYLMRAEAPGPSTEKLRPKISQTAKWLYAMYFVLTGCQIIALVISGLSFFHATLISFGTLATGGFSYLNTSLATFTVAQQIIVEVFMVMAGINFSLYFLLITGKIKKVLKDVEMNVYIAVIFAASLLIAINVLTTDSVAGTVGDKIHHTIFGVITTLTSTGFAAGDYNLWPFFSKLILVILMFIGGCAGSTAGGIKVSRIIMVFRSLRRSAKDTVNPREVNLIRYNGRTASDAVIISSVMYLGMIVMIVIISMFIVSLEPGMDIQTALSSVATALNNNGIEIRSPGVAAFADFSWCSRIVYIIDMLIGRLEIFPILALFMYAARPVARAAKKIRRF